MHLGIPSSEIPGCCTSNQTLAARWARETLRRDARRVSLSGSGGFGVVSPIGLVVSGRQAWFGTQHLLQDPAGMNARCMCKGGIQQVLHAAPKSPSPKTPSHQLRVKLPDTPPIRSIHASGTETFSTHEAARVLDSKAYVARHPLLIIT